MKNECEKIREQIPSFMADNLSIQESQNIQSHIETCSDCKKYLEAMQQDDRLLADYAESMQPRIAQMEHAVKAAVENTPFRRSSRFLESLAVIIENNSARLAAAAVLIIAISFSAGLAWGSRRSSERIRSFIEVSLKRDLQSELAKSYALLRQELRDEYQQQLNRYAMQTLAASNAATNQLLSQLVAAINASRERELEGILVALGQVESNRLRQNNELRKDLAAFASYTSDSLSKTQQQMDELWNYTRPGDNQENLNNDF